MLPDVLEKWDRITEKAKAEDDSKVPVPDYAPQALKEKFHQDTTSPVPAKE